jgi:urea transport system permease protein
MDTINDRSAVLPIALVAAVLLLMPFMLEPFWLVNLGKYLAFAFVALGIVLSWGYCGILSLGQGIFFGIGGYALAMFLKLEASSPNLPDFMVWSGVEALPIWWRPFRSLSFTVAAIVLLPVMLSFPMALALFRKRVSGVYFAIVTTALAMTLTVVIVGQQGISGGANGITDFHSLAGLDIVRESSRPIMYWVEVAMLVVCMGMAAALLRTRLGKVLIAIRDREDRVRFSGYDTALLKAFIFAVSATFSSIGGAMFTIQVGLITPNLLGTVASVEMVIYAAVGGRLSITGAVVGAVVVGFLKSYLSEQFPEIWLLFLGGAFILVVALMPNGVAGLADRLFARNAPLIKKTS